MSHKPRVASAPVCLAHARTRHLVQKRLIDFDLLAQTPAMAEFALLHAVLGLAVILFYAFNFTIFFETIPAAIAKLESSLILD